MADEGRWRIENYGIKNTKGEPYLYIEGRRYNHKSITPNSYC
jgi:hypothetical protein